MAEPGIERSVGRGDRVEVIRDCVDEQGLPFSAGQTGTVGGRQGGLVVVELDGYEQARERHRLQQERLGEGFNVLPWAGLLDASVLRRLR